MSVDFGGALRISGWTLIVIWCVNQLDFFFRDAEGGVSTFARVLDAIFGTVSNWTLTIGIALVGVGVLMSDAKKKRR